MKLIAQVKLLPSPEQASALRDTLEVANAACNYVSEQAWQNDTFGQFKLQKLVYYDVREKFGITSGLTVRVIARVADAYKLLRQKPCKFRRYGAIPYDDHIVHWYTREKTVNIWTVQGRQWIKFVCGERQWALLQNRQGESDLVYDRSTGNFYLFATCNVLECEPEEVDDSIGVDLGITNIASDSDRNVYSGSHLNSIRHRSRRLRSKLQKKGTKSAKRLLRKRSRKESRFARNINHIISKRLVTAAQDTYRAIALEDLTGIRERTTARKHQRATRDTWAFAQLRHFIEYKARRAGVAVLPVNPRNTSRACPSCGHIDKRNRPSQSRFLCVSCGFSGPADTVAAENIRRAAGNQPYAPTSQDASGASPPW